MGEAEPGSTADRIGAAGYLDDLEARPLEWVRAERTSVSAYEDQISYVRRLLQGRLDIIHAEQSRRRDGAEHDLSTLVDDLPGILAEGGHTSSSGRLSAVLAPGDLAPSLVERMAAAAPDRLLTGITDASDADLADSVTRLAALEHEVSAERRSCHQALDRLGAEVVRRYRDGEASVDSLLP